MYGLSSPVATAAKAREQALPNRGYGGEYFYTAALSTLPLETAAVVSNRF
jgi:hypothetical protein